MPLIQDRVATFTDNKAEKLHEATQELLEATIEWKFTYKKWETPLLFEVLKYCTDIHILLNRMRRMHSTQRLLPLLTQRQKMAESGSKQETQTLYKQYKNVENRSSVHHCYSISSLWVLRHHLLHLHRGQRSSNNSVSAHWSSVYCFQQKPIHFFQFLLCYNLTLLFLRHHCTHKTPQWESDNTFLDLELFKQKNKQSLIK